jgi:hypothetical protein
LSPNEVMRVEVAAHRSQGQMHAARPMEMSRSLID